MFTKARLQLTLFYTLLFFVLFWVFSFGIYFWMDRSFGEGYISEVKQQQTQKGDHQGEFDDSQQTLTTIAGDVALKRLLTVLITINSILLFIIPIISWYLAKKSLEPIQAAHEKQNQFVADASHELRTPISIMIAEIEVALKKERAEKDYKIILKSNKEELERLGTLVKNLLFLARDGVNKQHKRMEEIDLTDLLSTLIIQFKPIYQKKQILIELHPAEDSVTMKGNFSDIRQLFLNLIDNAIKYTDKGRIDIDLRQTNKFVRVNVSDTGMGISQKNQKLLFDRFYRVEMARSETKGYGLGLSICKAIVESYHGSIGVNSIVNQGSVFTVILPK